MASRFWLVVLLALSLWPSPAAASTGVPEGEPDRITGTDADYGNHVFRSPAGLEVVGRFESGALRTARGSTQHRSESGSGPSPHVFSGSELMLAQVRRLAGPSAETGDDLAVPLCERLPYFATAPPSSR